MSGKGTNPAGRPEAVAAPTSGEAPRPTSVDDPAPQADDATAPDHSKCADCGSTDVVYVTEDPAAESKAYCDNCKPANVTEKMVEEQGRK